MSNRQIAEHLTLAESTVKWYARQIFNKLGVNKRRDAVARAQTLGLVQTDVRATTFRHNLPHAMTPFLGRAAELSALDKIVSDPKRRIVTVIGPGGMGKTRLALEVARRHAQRRPLFPDGIYFVALAALESADEIVEAVVTALAIQRHADPPGNSGQREQLLEFLVDKRMLLVLDNFEHLLDGRELLTRIVAKTGSVKLLVTSRQRLQLSGEQLFYLQGMAVPQDDSDSGALISDYAAVQLFVTTAERLLPDFKLNVGDAEQLVRICRLVDGMPLGLELAAAWAGVMSLATIAEEIEQSLHVLNATYHDKPQRHRSMQATLELSWQRLNAHQRRGFQNLTVFRGGITRTAAAQVADVTLPVLVTLVNKSWLAYDREEDRYTVHELQRQFGAAKLKAEIGRAEQAREQHSIFFCGYLHQREEAWFGSSQTEAAADVQREIENIREAWRWASTTGNGDLLGQGLNTLCYFYQRESRNADGQLACQMARTGLEATADELRELSQSALVLLSRILSWESEFTQAVARKEDLLDQSQTILNLITSSETVARRQQAVLYREKARAANFANYEESLRLASHSLDLYRKLGDRWGESETLELIGNNYNYLGQYDKSTESLRKALEIKRQLTDINGIANVLHTLATVVRHQGAFEEAAALHGESLDLFQKLGNQRQQRWSHVSYSYTLLFAGNFSEALDIVNRGIELAKRLSLHPDPWLLNPLSFITLHLGRYDDAKRAATHALQLSKRRGERMNHSLALLFLGSVALAEEDLKGARRYLLRSIAILAKLKHVYQSILKAVLSYIIWALGDIAMSRHYLMAALGAGIEAGSVSPIVYCLPAAALHAVDRGNVERAVELYSMAQRFGLIANSRWFSDVAGDELAGLLASLPAEVVAEPLARGSGLELWSTAKQLLAELNELEQNQRD